MPIYNGKTDGIVPLNALYWYDMVWVGLVLTRCVAEDDTDTMLKDHSDKY